MTRLNKISTCLIAAVLVGGLTACGSAEASEESKTKLTLAAAPDFFYSHIYLAVQEGFLEKHGIDAELIEFPSGAEAVEAINAGQADVSSATASTVVNLAGKGADAKAIGSNLVGNGWFSMVAGPNLQVSDISNLQGKTVAAQHNGVLDFHVRSFFADHSYGIDKINYQNVKNAQLLTGLSRGDFDAVSMWEPNVSKALATIPGSSVVLDSDKTLPVTGYTVVSSDVYGNEDVAKRFQDAMAETITWMKDNPEAVLELAMDKSGVSDEAMAKAVQGKITYRAEFSDTDVQNLHETADFFREMGLLKATDEQVKDVYDRTQFQAWSATK